MKRLICAVLLRKFQGKQIHNILFAIIITIALITSRTVVNASIGDRSKVKGAKSIAGNLISLRKNIRKKISKNNKIISKLDARIVEVEEKLEKGSLHYLKVLKEKGEIESVIFNTKSGLMSSREKLEKIRASAQRALNGMILNALEQDQDAANLLGKQILVRELQTRLGKLNGEISNIDKQEKTIQKTEKKLASLVEFEKIMSVYLEDLEKKKKNSAIKYLGQIKNKDMLQVQYDNLNARVIMARKKKSKKTVSRIRFISPLKEYVGLKYKDKKKKGITYRFEGTMPVLAARKGEIVHSGSLASYGNIVIIKHENELRSVIFGNFLPKIPKGAKVQTGDVVGYTKSSRTGYGQVYFEVRKKNQVQDTIQLMDKDFLSKNFSKDKKYKRKI